MNSKNLSRTIVIAWATATVIFGSLAAFAKTQPKQDLLIKFAPGMEEVATLGLENLGSKVEFVSEGLARVQGTFSQNDLADLSKSEYVEYIQPNYKVFLLDSTYQVKDKLRRAAIVRYLSSKGYRPPATAADNPAIPDFSAEKTGADPLFSKQWGMNAIGATAAWVTTLGNPEFTVAVIDTGVDYTHEDLKGNMWRNQGEVGKDASGKDKGTNGVDDDGNGFVDDVVGWDFLGNDNKPYDLATSNVNELLNGGNPGHGTHCAGNVAAKGGNAVGVSGVAPNVKVMALRFIGNEGGTTADAVKAIHYAVDNGAKVLSNSWGSEGDDPEDQASNLALREAVAYAEQKGVLFIAAAGNGHSGKGYDNDTDAKPGVPASYDHANIISVAAIDVADKLGSFSNWGKKTVDLAAPGVNVFSTTVGSKYNDKVINFAGFVISWDGTSMATPHVAGAAALYWSAHPEKSYAQVKEAILASAKRIPALENKMVSNGKLDVQALLNF